ncbi:NPL4-like protein 2 [Bienertia sinuspersici]
MVMLRVRSRDGVERLSIDNPNITIGELKTLIESQLHVPVSNQVLSLQQNLLLAKTPADRSRFLDMANPQTPISSLKIGHGSLIFLSYDGEREIVAPTRRPSITPAGSFGKKMTMDDLIAKQMRVTRQESPNCALVSFDRDAANAFQHYVNETLAFAVKRGGIMYGTVSDEGKVEVDFIYEPPQLGQEESLVLMRDSGEENIVDAIATGLGMRKVGFIFTQAVGQDKKDYTMSHLEVAQAIELHAEGGLKEWVTALVKIKVNDGGGADVHFEAFQMSDMSIRLFKEGWFEFERKEGEEVDPKVSLMKKDVVVGGKDVKEVDNDFFLVVVKIFDHQGPLSSTFPIENRVVPVTTKAVKTHLDRTKSLPFVKRISDFHLLLTLARFLDLKADIPALTECVHSQSTVPEGYQLLIESIANAGV